MQAYLIISNNKSFTGQQIATYKKRFNVSKFNYHELKPSPSIGIEKVRQLQKILNLKSFGGQNRLICIREADRLTLEAQNALLKILEEPPEETYIVLTTGTIDNLLPTIVSRCQVITNGAIQKEVEDGQKELGLLKKIFTSSPGERILLAQELASSKEEMLALLDTLVESLQKLLHEKSKDLRLSYKEIAATITKVSAAKRYIEKNSNVKATLDILFLGLPKVN